MAAAKSPHNCGKPCGEHGSPCIAIMNDPNAERAAKVMGMYYGPDHTHRCVQCILDGIEKNKQDEAALMERLRVRESK